MNQWYRVLLFQDFAYDSIILPHECESKYDDDDTVSTKVGNVVASPHGIADDEYCTVPPSQDCFQFISAELCR